MRLAALLLVAAAAFGSPAAAGVRASYAIADEAKPLIVEVAENGDASFAIDGGEVRVVVIGGHAFAIWEGDDGPEAVRFGDLTRALQSTGTPALEPDDDLPAMASDLAKAVPLLAGLRATPAGARTVAGVAGTAYRIVAPPGVKLEGATMLVATDATELRPIGAAIGVILAEGSGIVALFDRIGPDTARLMRIFGSLAALGTPLEWKGLYALRSVEARRIPPETIALPGPPIAPDALVGRVRALSPSF